MSSQNGKERSFQVRHVFKTSRQEQRSTAHVLQHRQQAEQRKQMPWMPAPRSSLEHQRQEFLLSVLLHRDVPRVKIFGIQWNPECEWAKGSSIHPFANIFDRFVRGVWTVRVVDNIENTGLPGWIFERP